jgi:DNA-binding transcriptional LysR family regulator
MSDLPFTLDQLRILKAIAAEGSFKRAADSLYVSQPAVSLQVQNLERQLDVPLFDRGGRRAQLTEAGHLLLSYGEKILSLCQETCRAIEDLQNLQGGTLIVGASQTTGTYLLLAEPLGVSLTDRWIWQSSAAKFPVIWWNLWKLFHTPRMNWH